MTWIVRDLNCLRRKCWFASTFFHDFYCRILFLKINLTALKAATSSDRRLRIINYKVFEFLKEKFHWLGKSSKICRDTWPLWRHSVLWASVTPCSEWRPPTTKVKSSNPAIEHWIACGNKLSILRRKLWVFSCLTVPSHKESWYGV